MAISLFKNKIAPRFDFTEKFLIFDFKNSKIESKREIYCANLPIFHKFSLLFDFKVEILLCGGIRKWDYYRLFFSGVKVYPNIFGEIDEILKRIPEIIKTPPPFYPKIRCRGWRWRWGWW